jgi:hypothetical protein
MLIIIRIRFLRFKINPNVPIKNKNKAKFILVSIATPWGY